ncbi:MFS transporter [Buchananella hordeovulneris]|nr:MFS transporter [Buchananella hordeovulneris]
MALAAAGTELAEGAGSVQPSTNNYLRWLAADTALTLGSALRAFAIPALVFLATGSESRAGIIAAVAAFVSGACLLIGGVLVDKYDKRVLVLTQATIGVVVIGAATAWASVFGLSFGLLLVLGVIMALRGGLLGSASDIWLRDIVPAQELPRRMAVNEGRDATVELGGGPLAGVLVTWHWAATFVTEVVLSAVGFVAAWRLRPAKTAAQDDVAGADAGAGTANGAGVDSGTEAGQANGDAGVAAAGVDAAGTDTADALALPPSDGEPLDAPAAEPPATDAPAREGKIAAAFAGVALITRHALLRRIAVLSVLFFPLVNGFLLYLLLATLGGGGKIVSASLFNSAVAVGALVGSAVATKLVERVAAGKLVAATFFLPAPLTLAVTLVPWLWLKLVLLVPLFFLLPAGNASFGGFMMLVIPKHLLGRTFAATGLGTAICAPLVSLGLGFLLENAGPTVTGLTLAACLALVASAALTSRVITGLPLPDQWEEYIDAHQLRPAEPV